MESREFSLTVTQREGFQFEVDFEQPDSATLIMDEPPPLGHGEGPNAARVLGAAVGNCLSASLLFCLQRSRIAVLGLSTHVRGTVERNERGRFRIAGLRVQLEPEVAPEDRERMGRCLELFEDFCIVTESVRQGIAVEVAVGAAVGTP